MNWSDKFCKEEINNNLKLAYKMTIRSKGMQPHQQRVVDELKELQERLDKLHAFY